MCGVIGIIGFSLNHLPSHHQNLPPSFSASHDVFKGLLTLQHRGQDSAGILSYNLGEQKFHMHKDHGLIANVFDEYKVERLTGSMAIGHTRYKTAGGDDLSDLQPLVSGFSYGVGMAHNGNLINYHTIADFLRKKHQVQLLTTNDLEVFLTLWCKELVTNDFGADREFRFSHVERAVNTIFDKVVGGYSVTGIVANEGLFAFRDPQGIRPLVLGNKIDNKTGIKSYCVCSETASMNFVGYEYVRDVIPGEVIFISKDGTFNSSVIKNDKVMNCMFEWVYFSRAESYLGKKTVYRSRIDLGHVLADEISHRHKHKKVPYDVVVPIPDTSRPGAIAIAEELNLPYREALIKNRYVQRSFILNSQDKREKAVELKLGPIKSEIEGKRILLVDDSVVRGTTSRKIIEMLRKNGAKSVSLVITCPPIRFPCFYGIDFPSKEELIANNLSENEVAKILGADEVIYLGKELLKMAIGHDELCMACLDGKYPTCIEEGKRFAASRREVTL